jgi:hypothetical protein
MEPLLPAFSRAVDHWGSQAQTLAVLHDEQSALTRERIADIGPPSLQITSDTS